MKLIKIQIPNACRFTFNKSMKKLMQKFQNAKATSEILKKQKSPSLRKPSEYQNIIQVSHLLLDLNINSLL